MLTTPSLQVEQYLKRFELFTASEIEDFLQIGYLKNFKKNDFFIQEGGICQEVGFVLSGIFRSFYYSQAAEEVTYCFIFPNNLMAAYSSYITQKSTSENIQATTDARLLMFPKKDFNALIDSNSKWLLFSKIIAEQQYLEMEKRVITLQKEKAETRYQTMLIEQPEYLQQIPLQYIASYLGITQRHLSRLRKKISN